MIKIYNAKDITEAHIVKGMLEANGIDAYVNGHYLQGGIGELAAMDFASVQVDEKDTEAAKKLIETYEKTDIQNGPKPVNSNGWLIAPILIIVLGVVLAAILLIAI